MGISSNYFVASVFFHPPVSALPKRFIDNAVELQKLGVPTLQVLQYYRLQAPGMTAVLYQPLPGQTLRQIASKDGFNWPQALPELAGLIRRLHQSRDLLRSLHLGNIVITPDNRIAIRN